MAGYTCTKCGETAYSKCASSRSVFPNDQLACLIGNAWDIDANRRIPPPERQATSNFSDAWNVEIKGVEFGHNTDDEAIWALITTIRETSEKTLKIALCCHSWRLDDEKCDLGCCTRK